MRAGLSPVSRDMEPLECNENSSLEGLLDAILGDVGPTLGRLGLCWRYVAICYGAVWYDMVRPDVL